LLGTVLAAYAQAPATGSRDLSVTVGKSVLVDSPEQIERVAVANATLAEAVAVTPREVMINGKTPGETSVIIWQQGGNRLFFDLTVLRNEARIDAIRREMARELGSDRVELDLHDDSVFLRGTVPDLTAADRAVAIASTLGRPVNLLRVDVPGTDAQILLKVKFADVDRSVLDQLGLNLVSSGAAGNLGRMTTGQFPAPTITPNPAVGGTFDAQIQLTQALNIFLLRPDLNLGATIAALRARNLLQILAEPNVLAMNGRPASFLAGGEFPFPTLQGGASVGAVTIQFREFGVRINATPVVTPRGTIKLTVTPEVSSLDFANGLVFQGFTIPAINTRRVTTEIELEDGQSFAIGGLLDNRDTETFNRIPGLADIPFFGKLFRSRQISRTNTELLVMVTPELVRPIPKDAPRPELKYPSPFLPPNTSADPPRTPGIETTGPVPLPEHPPTIPVEQLIKSQAPPAQQTSPIQYVPVPLISVPQQQTQPPGQAPAPAPAPAKPPGAP
jgi:pilus assembly protein CpaC